MDKINRIIDANLNRAREGLRVVEELARLVLEHAQLQKQIKTIRHGITQAENFLPKTQLLKSRAAYRDPGAKTTLGREKRRADLQDLALANIRRVQEALRVLEEVWKLKNKHVSSRFKSLRFKTYDLENILIQQLEKYNSMLKQRR